MIDAWFIGFSRIGRTGSGIKYISDSLVPPKKINNRSILVFFLKTFKFFFAIIYFMKLLRKIFLLLTIVFWGISAWAQNFSESGVGKWEKLPFGQVRLLSCTTGIQDRNIMVGGLQVKIKDGWILHKPDLTPLFEDAMVEYPIRPNPVQTKEYTDDLFIPIIYNIDGKKDFVFGVHGNLKGCWDDNCLDVPIRIALPLDEKESKYTSYCAYIMEQVNSVPRPISNVSYGKWLNDSTALLSFKLPDITQAFLQNENGFDFRILETKFLKDEIQFKVSYPQKWQNNTMQDWVLITNQGVFRVPVVLSSKPIPQTPKDKPWGMFVLSGLLLFICSPFFILFGTSFLKNKKQLRQQCVRAIIASSILIPIFCFMPNINEMDILFPWVWIAMGITLIFIPRFVWWTALLFVVWPKPILNEMTENFSLWYLIPWLVMWNVLPFGLLYRYADFWGKKGRFSLKHDFFLHNLFFLLPTIYLLFSGIHSHFINVPYENAPKMDKTRINVICEKSDCQNWMAFLPSVRFINPKSNFGKELQNLYNTDKTIVVFDDSGIETVLTDITPKKLEKYLIGLQNYRAQYRPVDPPIHSGDDRHDLSPNAM